MTRGASATGAKSHAKRAVSALIMPARGRFVACCPLWQSLDNISFRVTAKWIESLRPVFNILLLQS
jgi:hypothetical protein